LASIVLSSLQSARVDARDAVKVKEVKSGKQALELYHNDHGAYPALDGSGNVVPGDHADANIPIVAKEEASNNDCELITDGLTEEGYISDAPQSDNDGFAYINTGEEATFQATLGDEENFPACMDQVYDVETPSDPPGGMVVMPMPPDLRYKLQVAPDTYHLFRVEGLKGDHEWDEIWIWYKSGDLSASALNGLTSYVSPKKVHALLLTPDERYTRNGDGTCDADGLSISSYSNGECPTFSPKPARIYRIAKEGVCTDGNHFCGCDL